MAAFATQQQQGHLAINRVQGAKVSFPIAGSTLQRSPFSRVQSGDEKTTNRIVAEYLIVTTRIQDTKKPSSAFSENGFLVSTHQEIKDNILPRHSPRRMAVTIFSTLKRNIAR